MASVIKYIGRTTEFRGKTLWEIVGNLKDFGVGRVIVRSTFERYPEKSFMKILKVELMKSDPDSVRKVRVWVEKTFRGRRVPMVNVIDATSYKPDYRLIPKDEEVEYCKIDQAIEEHGVPSYLEFPPLMKEMILKGYADKGLPLPTDLKLPLTLATGTNSVYKREKNSTVMPIGLKNPIHPELFSDIQISQ